MFNIAGFTHIGTEREFNQDRILTQDVVSKDGLYSFDGVGHCFCFVADGIGGGPAGDLAAQFVLENINQRISRDQLLAIDELGNILGEINMELLAMGKATPEYLGAGSTLVGLIIIDGQFRVINAGDSPAYVFRNGSFIKITEDQVFDPYRENSPLISYFGGRHNELHLDFDTVLSGIQLDDIFLLSSYGMFKSLDVNQIKAVLPNSKPLAQKSKFLMEKSIKAGAEDNLSCILIEIVE